MEYGFSILMFIFAGALLLYAALMIATKDVRFIPYRVRGKAKMKNRQAYVAWVGKIVALTACAPLLGGLVGLLNAGAGMAALAVGLVAFIWLGVKLMKRDGQID